MLALQKVLRIKNLKFGYQDLLFENLNFEAKLGQNILLKGSNGTGKSTFLRILAGLLLPAEGEVEIPKNFKVSFLPAGNFGFFPRLTVKQNLDFYFQLKSGNKFLMPGLDNFLEIDYWDSPIESLSQGMLQKVKWVAALHGDPDLLLLDEPLVALDLESTDKVLSKLDVLGKQKNKIIFLAQHQVQWGNRILTKRGKTWEE